jgi:Fe2+ or Zn2+ uptake regulation protein
MLTARQVDATLRLHGGRTTRQRRMVYAALAASHDHPTAGTLHREIRRRLPSLSLATVYRSLEVLVRAGLAIRLAHASGVARYDARTDAHDHLRCLGCGRVEDLQVPRRPGSPAVPPHPSFTVTDYHLELVGYCAECGAPSRYRGDTA